MQASAGAVRTKVPLRCVGECCSYTNSNTQVYSLSTSTNVYSVSTSNYSFSTTVGQLWRSRVDGRTAGSRSQTRRDHADTLGRG